MNRDLPPANKVLCGKPRPGRDAFQVCFNIDNRRFARSERLVERTSQFARFIDGYTETAHRFGHFSEIGVGEQPELIGSGCPPAVNRLYAPPVPGSGNGCC